MPAAAESGEDTHRDDYVISETTNKMQPRSVRRPIETLHKKEVCSGTKIYFFDTYIDVKRW